MTNSSRRNSAGADPAIAVHGLTKIVPVHFHPSRRVVAVKDLTLRIEPGEVYGLPEAAPWDRRFSAYELSYSEGREREAYERLRSLYDEGEKERLPTLIKRLQFLEDKLAIPQEQRIPEKPIKR